MGCFFGCFRFKDDRRLPTSSHLAADHRLRSKPAESLESRNRLSSLFLSEGNEESSRNERVKVGMGYHMDDKALKDEAKFLKACGTLAGTPAEIRKASGKLKMSPSCSKDSESSKFHSWLPNAPVEKLQLGIQPIDPQTPTESGGEWRNCRNSSDLTPSSCISNAQYAQSDSVNSTEDSRAKSISSEVKTPDDRSEQNAALASPWPTVADTQRKNKSVRFECETDSSCGSSSAYGGGHMEKTGSPNNQSAYKSSPYATPRKLSDDMQTPGTVYPATLEDFPNSKPRVRSQFVYSFQGTSGNVSQFKIPEEEESNSEQDSNDVRSSLRDATPTSEQSKQQSSEDDTKVEESLSAWLKPAAVIEEERRRRMEAAYGQIPPSGKTPADRPIIGMVAAHWSEEDGSDTQPPKWWDGNGIPNSTNKYKEDQKVSWHATPFEERLEKALSEDSIVPQRKNVCGKPIAFDDNEESDTAVSNMHTSGQPRSVVSF